MKYDNIEQDKEELKLYLECDSWEEFVLKRTVYNHKVPKPIFDKWRQLYVYHNEGTDALWIKFLIWPFALSLITGISGMFVLSLILFPLFIAGVITSTIYASKTLQTVNKLKTDVSNFSGENDIKISIH